MIHIDLQPELEAQLSSLARILGLSTEQYVEQIITNQAAEIDAAEARARISRGLPDVAAGRTRPAQEVFAELDKEYGLQG